MSKQIWPPTPKKIPQLNKNVKTIFFPNFNFVKTRKTLVGSGRRSMCAMGKCAPPSAHAYCLNCHPSTILRLNFSSLQPLYSIHFITLSWVKLSVSTRCMTGKLTLQCQCWQHFTANLTIRVLGPQDLAAVYTECVSMFVLY